MAKRNFVWLLFLFSLSTILHSQVDDLVDELIRTEMQKFPHRSAENHSLAAEQSYLDARYYDLSFQFILVPEFTMIADVLCRIDVLTDSVNRFFLDFSPVQRGNIPWKNLRVSGEVDTFYFAGNRLWVELSRYYHKHETVEITVHYEGYPGASGFMGFEYTPDYQGHPLISTLSEPYYARNWWPCIDNPRDKADSVTIRVRVPSHLSVGSNGTLEEVVPEGDGTQTWIWKERYPITTYLVSLAISDYAILEDEWNYNGIHMPIMHFVFPEQLETVRTAFAPLPEMLTAFSDLFGVYPFHTEKYGHAVFQWGGGMEHQTLTSIGAVTPQWERIYAHELGHQWFGDLITCHNWQEIWMNEGFASYTEALWEEYSRGWNAYVQFFRNTLSSIRTWGIRSVFVRDTTSVSSIFHRTVYTKGMWVLHMLRFELGDSLFLDILKKYATDSAFRFSTVTTGQFQQFCEELSGRDLEEFFRQWIYYEGYPIIRYNFLVNGNGVQFRMQQSQTDSFSTSAYYTLRLPVRLIYADGSREDRNILLPAVRDFSGVLEADKSVSSVILDPDNRILAKYYADKQLIPETSRFVTIFPNPSRSQLFLDLNESPSRKVELAIYDLTGRSLFRQLLLPGEIVLPLAVHEIWPAFRTLPTGIYILQTSLDGRKTEQKVIKIH